MCNGYWNNTCQEIKKCWGNIKASKAWKLLNNLRTQNKGTAGLNLISMEEKQNDYKTLLTEDRADFIEDLPSSEEAKNMDENNDKI